MKTFTQSFVYIYAAPSPLNLRFFFVLLFASINYSVSAEEGIAVDLNTAKTTTNPDLYHELTLLCVRDQEARFRVIDAGNLDTDEGKEIIEKIDQEHLPRLKAIVEQFGWPGFSIVGGEGAEKMWLLVQHCDQDVEFQKRCLTLLTEAVAKGDAYKRHLAYLTDRVLVNEGKPQIYGTQALIIDGQILLSPVEDSDQLDERREIMGLGPITDYLTRLKEVYHLSK